MNISSYGFKSRPEYLDKALYNKAFLVFKGFLKPLKMHYKIEIVPRNVPRNITVTVGKKRYSDPKLYIPKKDGKATVEPNKRWYVYFYWRTDPNGVLDRKLQFTKNINRFNTVKERKAVGNALVDAYRLALSRGWHPIEKKTIKKEPSRNTLNTIIKALEYSMKVINTENKSEATVSVYKNRLNIFTQWLTNNNLAGLNPNSLTTEHFYMFLDYLRFEYKKKDGKVLSNTTIDNYRREIGAIFSVLQRQRIIVTNPIKGVAKIKSKPIKNKAFTSGDIKKIKDYLLRNDPYLIDFISFIIYPLFRPKEICRLKVSDIDLNSMTIGVETKTGYNRRKVIEKIKPIILKMDLEQKRADVNLFTHKNKPIFWDAKLKTKVDHFGYRFKKVRDALGFSKEYTIYSFRHSAILNLYNNLQKSGLNEREIIYKLMPITKHRSEAGIRNYLRDIKHSIPRDHSDMFTINF
jgi:integrase